MSAGPIAAMALIVGLGIAAQYIAWRLRIPGIVLLLATGFLAGPVLGWLDPDALLGDLLPPLVAVGVALIVFEGGLGLEVREVRRHGVVVSRLVTLGVIATWLLAWAAARWILGLSLGTAALVGAIVVVSGPTVVIPLLRHVRARRDLEAVAQWEGILIDPVGAVLAVLVFETVVHAADPADLVGRLALTLGTGALLGLLGAGLIVLMENRFWLPDFLGSAFAVAVVIAAYAGSEVVRDESGLVAVTVAGIALANQRWATVHHILAWKEQLSVLLLGSLFILLAARMEAGAMLAVASDPRAWIFVIFLIAIARPLTVWISARGTSLDWRDKAFLAGLAPRGIVAAAVAALFSLRLAEEGGGPDLTPLVFFVVVVTVVFYGAFTRPWARMLKVAGPEPEGVLLVGANVVTRELASALQQEDVRVLILDTDPQALTAARMDNLEAISARLEDRNMTETLDLAGIGRLWAITPSPAGNALAAVRFAEEFGRGRVYQVAIEDDEESQGRLLFDGSTYRQLRDRVQKGWHVRRTSITERFTPADHRGEHPDAIWLWVRTSDGNLKTYARGVQPEPSPGDTLAALVPPEV